MGNRRTLWVIGDSTLSCFEDKYYYPRYGYGTMLKEFLDDTFDVENIALSGRSSKSFTTEPEYKTLLNGMKDGDFLIIGFGHNDEKTEKDRFTDANGDYREVGSFANSIYTNYIVPANKAGAKVILCTPIVRRTPNGQWNDVLLHITKDAGEFKGGDYPSAIRKLGEMLSIPVIDMTEITRKLYDSLGSDETIYLHAWTSNKPMSVDNTHTNIWGARVNAYNVLKQVKALNISGISEHIVIDENSDIPSKEVYLKANEDYVPTVFNSDLKDSTLWEDVYGWKGTIFGDIGEKGNLSDYHKNFILEKDSDNNIHIAVKDNVGKIAGVSDGIAMYYKKIDVDKKFVFSAKLRINDYFLNDQVSFGLMVRDDIYIDKQTADILGDYVAAAPLMLTHEDKAWNCFARKSGVLTKGGICTRKYNVGDIVNVRIESSNDGYACTFGDEATITGGFDFKLTSVDPEHVYAGMFVARNADVTFMDIELEYLD